MKANPLKCIMVGVINRGRFLTDLMTQSPERFTLVAFADKSVEVARAEADRLGWASMPCHASLADAIRSVKADAAIITSPARFHSEQIRTCLDAGLHVFVAKPMTYDLDEAEQLVQLAERKKLCLVVDQQQMFTLTERTLAEWVRAKKYGEVGFVEFRIHRYRPNMAAFTGDAPFIWEQGVHSFNSMLAILGRPAVSVSARQIKPRWSAYNGPTVCMAEIEFEGGLLCHYLGTFDSRTLTIEVRVECEQASMRAIAADSWHKRLEVALPGKVFETIKIDDAQDTLPAERFNFDAFYRGCTRGGRVVNDGRDNLRTLAIVAAFIRSSRSGKREAVRQF